MRISEAESVVMQALWTSSPLAAEDVFAAVAGDQDWQEPTVKTLLNRLLKKGTVSAVREGRRYLYAPVLTREDWLRQESESLVDRLFGGRIAPMVAHFTERGRLSRKDLAELRRLLEDLDDGR